MANERQTEPVIGQTKLRESNCTETEDLHCKAPWAKLLGCVFTGVLTIEYQLTIVTDKEYAVLLHGYCQFTSTITFHECHLALSTHWPMCKLFPLTGTDNNVFVIHLVSRAK